uniref:R13L1/DRL21-like LRR repeat region domain-containing protein n=1 Tax=Oryza nivara TaxID=4536 RepID=A0A0E0J038_ORYNI
MEDIDVLRDLLPPSTLQHFDLQGYKSISFPGWLMNISHYVPNIVKIKLEDLPMCNILPALGQLQNLQELFLGTMSSITKIDGDFCGCVRAFPQLVKFTLYYMKSLEEWTTTYSYGEDFVNEMIDNVISSWGAGCTDTSSSSSPVTNLEVDSCKVPLCQWRLLQRFPVLPLLSINRCNDLTSLPDINRDPSTIELLSPQDINERAAPKYLCEVTSRKLKVNVSQETVRRPISLQSLRLSNCASITSLPEWLGDLSSLEKLEIFNCGGIKSLPKSIEKFNKLKYQIFGCPKLKLWCEYKDKMWLHHVEKIIR